MDFEEDINHSFEDKQIEEELYLNTNYKTLNDIVVFLVDLQISDVSIFNQIFLIIESFLKTKIITNENDQFGLFFYNTNKPSNTLGIEGVNILIDIAPSDATLIKKIKHLNQNYKHTPSKNQYSLNNALWVCQHELKLYDPSSYNRRIFLFTENDYPILDEEDREITIQRAKDLAESEIAIELFPMNTRENSLFNIKKFYIDIIPVSFDNLPSLNDYYLTKEYSEERVKEITKRIRQKEIKKKTLGTCDFKFSHNVEFKVNFFATIKKTYKSSAVLIEPRKNKELSNLIQPICKDSSSILYSNQIGTCQSYGKTKIPFSRDDMNKIKAIEEPGLKLIGFKSIDKIKVYHNIKSSYFITPDEDLNPGSSQLCDALIKQLIQKNKVAIVKFIPREGCGVRFCALLPQKETFDADLFQTPPGFNLVFIPYAEEIRSNGILLEQVRKNYTIDYSIKAKEEEKDLAKKIIKKMSIDFDSRGFENPSIQKFYSCLQALALGENNTDNYQDVMMPDEEGFLMLKGCDEEFFDYYNKMKLLQNEVKMEVEDNYEDNENNSPVKNKKTKRDHLSDTKSNSKKKSKDSYIEDYQLLTMQKNDELRQLTVLSLKENLEHRNIKAQYKSRKDELLLKLEDYLMSIEN